MVTTTEQRTLAMPERCDRCGMRAYVTVLVNGVELMFCKHHYEAHEPMLIGKATAMRDERSQLCVTQPASTR